jgi:hypothetical protein
MSKLNRFLFEQLKIHSQNKFIPLLHRYHFSKKFGWFPFDGINPEK